MTPNWPKTITVYLGSEKESNWRAGEEIGLSEEAIKKNFKYCLYEVAVEIEVNEDGTYKIIGFKET